MQQQHAQDVALHRNARPYPREQIMLRHRCDCLPHPSHTQTAITRALGQHRRAAAALQSTHSAYRKACSRKQRRRPSSAHAARHVDSLVRLSLPPAHSSARLNQSRSRTFGGRPSHPHTFPMVWCCGRATGPWAPPALLSLGRWQGRATIARIAIDSIDRIPATM